MMSRYVIVEKANSKIFFVKDTADDRFIPIERYPGKQFSTTSRMVAQEFLDYCNETWELEGKFQPS